MKFLRWCWKHKAVIGFFIFVPFYVLGQPANDYESLGRGIAIYIFTCLIIKGVVRLVKRLNKVNFQETLDK